MYAAAVRVCSLVCMLAVGCCYTHRRLPNAQFGNDFAEKKVLKFYVLRMYVRQHKLRKGKNALFILPQIFMLFVFLASA